jgi:putative aldouronate transport system permease protein
MRKYTRYKDFNLVSAPANFALIAFFTIISLLCIIPMVIVLSSSLTSEATIINVGYPLIPKKPELTAYAFVFSDQGKLIRAYAIQIFTTVVGTFLSVLITAMIAYPLSRSELPYRRFFAFFVYFTMLFSGGLAPTYYVYTHILHLKNTLPVLFIPYLVGGFNVIILRTFFASNVSSEIIDSAKIDGSGHFRTFFKIVFPISLPGISAIAMLTTVGYWNDWYLSMLYIDTEQLTNLQYMMYKTLQSIQYLRANDAFRQSFGAQVMAQLPLESSRMAMAIIGMGPILIVYPFFQKYFIKGLTIGSLKG